MKTYEKKISSFFTAVIIICLFFSLLLIFQNKAFANGYDTTPPRINSIQFNSDITKPGVLKVTLDVTEEETGIVGYEICFRQDVNNVCYTIADDQIIDPVPVNQSIWSKSPKFSGKHTFSLPVPSTSRTGSYHLEYIVLLDKAGNTGFYSWDILNSGLKPSDGNSNVCLVNGSDKSGLLFVKDEFPVNFQTYITNGSTTSKINSMTDGEAASILFDSSNSIAKKEWFEAIKGKNKTLVFSNDAIQWVFSGKDVVNPAKDINLGIKVLRVDGADYGNGNDVLEISFADNGTLPAKARVRLKADYIYDLLQLHNTAYLYYVNGNNASLESSNVNCILDGNDHWCEFYVTHNSKFIISSQKIIPNSFATKAGTFKIISTNNKSAAFAKAKNKKSVTVPATITINGKTYAVTQINEKAFTGNKIRTVTVGKNVKVIKKNAFAKSKVNKLILKTKLLTKSKVKGSLNSSKIRTIQVKAGSKSLNKKIVKKYKKFFTKKNAGRAVKIK